jgi:hypothetical protein
VLRRILPPVPKTNGSGCIPIARKEDLNDDTGTPEITSSRPARLISHLPADLRAGDAS